MKKLAILMLMSISIYTFAQKEFRKTFNSFSYKDQKDTEFKDGTMSTILVFNYKNEPYVMLYLKDSQTLLKITENTVRKTSEDTGSYQEIKIIDSKGDLGVLMLFDDPYYGCLMVTSNSVIGFYNK